MSVDGTGPIGVMAAAGGDDAATLALNTLAGLPAAKRIAAATLYVEAMRPVSREQALASAAQAYADQLGPSRGGLKKVVSEARAVLSFGLADPQRLKLASRLPSSEMLAALSAAVRDVNLREVTRARAMALAGGRGGRPTARTSAAYSAVRKLLDLAEAGDAAARAELTAIRDLVRPPGLERRADRPAASR